MSEDFAIAKENYFELKDYPPNSNDCIVLGWDGEILFNNVELKPKTDFEKALLILLRVYMSKDK